MTENDRQIAETILRQIGWGQFKLLTSATAYVIERGISIEFKGSRKASILKVRLNGGDLYDMEFMKIVKDKETGCRESRTVETFNDVYFDQLIPLFESTTNLYAHF